MAYPILGLHHVTATVDAAQSDLDFCLDGLGLRLVKKTVNFDNHHVYHFYYGDERGTPGTIWTTFPYHGRGVPVGTKGAGQITVTSLSVPAGSLDFWRKRLRDQGTLVQDAAPRFGEESIVATDPSGLAIELIGTDSDVRQPWTGGGVGSDAAVRGLHSVSMVIRSPEPTLDFLTTMMGFSVADEMEGRSRLAVKDSRPGMLVEVVHGADAHPAYNGLGTVHHVAFAVESADDQRRVREDLLQRGYRVTAVLDRQYFQSIYFREPGGVLFEVATMHPGFSVDEPVDCLGRDLKLPPWEEPNRSSIETGLAPVTYR